MKAFYVFVRIIATPFILLFKLSKILCVDMFEALKRVLLRSKYWEERIVLILAIIILGPVLWWGLPITFAALFGLNWLWGLWASAAFTMFYSLALYEVNHNTGDYNSYKFSIEGEVNWKDVKWGYDVELKKAVKKIEVDEHDPDYIEGKKEVERVLSEDTFTHRLKAKKGKK
jgi:hypothetical protein